MANRKIVNTIFAKEFLRMNKLIENALGRAYK
jgi:hypothetical protein